MLRLAKHWLSDGRAAFAGVAGEDGWGAAARLGVRPVFQET